MHRRPPDIGARRESLTMNATRPLACALLALGFGSQVSARSVGDYAGDVRDYAVAPLHWDAKDWQWFGVTVAGVAAAYSVDDRVRGHFAPPTLRRGGDPHEFRDAAPLAALTAGTLAFGLLRRDAALTGTGADMVEAVGLGAMSSFVLKAAAGRERPDETTSRSRWGEGGSSFPSMHVTAAFAAARVFADEMPREQWGWRAMAYTLAGATAYARIDSNKHWLSDTVASASLGLATGKFVSGRGAAGHDRLSWMVAPLSHGAMLAFSVEP
jgi:membrane-associated phospholipid phosphatase